MTQRHGWWTLTLVLAAWASLTVPTQAQGTPESKLPAGTKPSVVEFSAGEPAKFSEIGMSIPVPLGALALQAADGPSQKLEIIAEDQSWKITIRAPRLASGKEFTIEQYADKAEDAIRASMKIPLLKRDASGNISEVDPSTDAATAKDSDRRLKFFGRMPDAEGHNLYIDNAGKPLAIARFYARKDPDGTIPPIIHGFTVGRLSASQYVTFELFVAAEKFDHARAVYEATTAAATFGDFVGVNMDRGASVEAGKALFATLDDAAYREVLAARPEQWFRMYRPAPTGLDSDATEVGYTRVITRTGQRGEVDTTKNKASWSAIDRQEGYMVEIAGRLLQKPQVIDTAATYFVTTNHESEMWLARTTVRATDEKGRESNRTAQELGVREGSSMTVTVSAQAMTDTTTRPVIQDDSYLSMVDALLAPQVIIRSKAVADYGYYAWNSSAGRIRLRRDRVERPSDMPNTWRITTTHGDSEVGQVSLYKDDGTLIRTTMPDGIIIEPISSDILKRMWKAKGLPGA